MKLWKKIAIVILIIFLIFVIFVARKFFILLNISNKVSKLDNNNNVYIKTTMTYNNQIISSENFSKDDIRKDVFEYAGTRKIIQITYHNERKVYTEENNNKTMSVYHDYLAPGTTTYYKITNFAENMSFLDMLYNSISGKFKTIDFDGKKCYEISNIKGNIETVIIEKNTGLALKQIRIENINNVTQKVTSTTEYKFNSVTDEDLKEPDESQYVREN